MTRATNAVASRERRKSDLALAKGYRGSRSRLYRCAVEAARKGLMYSFVGRRRKKGDFRTMWIARIGAALQEKGISYSKFIHLLSECNIIINRKMLSEMAINDKPAFDQLVNKVLNK